ERHSHSDPSKTGTSVRTGRIGPVRGNSALRERERRETASGSEAVVAAEQPAESALDARARSSRTVRPAGRGK
ncbi:MAG: hypothetical protein WBQ21_14720, partial [Solirubrobacteraceae bacterium]